LLHCLILHHLEATITMTKRGLNLNKSPKSSITTTAKRQKKMPQQDLVEELFSHADTGCITVREKVLNHTASSSDSEHHEPLGDEERVKIRQEAIKAATSTTMRRHAIAYQYLVVLKAPPKEKWNGKGGTVNQIVAKLDIPMGSSSIVRDVLRGVERALATGVEYDGAVVDQSSVGSPTSVLADSIELQIIAEAIESGLSMEDVTLRVVNEHRAEDGKEPLECAVFNTSLSLKSNVILMTSMSTAGRSWTADEDSKLKDAVQTHGGKNWVAITALVRGRTRMQCYNRWKDYLNPSINRANERTGSFTADEDSKLMDAVQMHGGKNWVAIAALVPGRTERQCNKRWHNVLNRNINQANERKGKWTEDEDIKLEDAVQTHGDKDWVAISAMVPGRTGKQCWNRWKEVLDPSIDRIAGRTGKWTADEDSKLKDAMQAHGGKNWGAIATLVPGRTKKQCNLRWHGGLDPSIDRTPPERMGKWTEDEDIKLKDAVQTHGVKDWGAIAALVPGRTKKQCNRRWQDRGIRSAARERQHGTFNNSSPLEQDPPSP
jgi:hypothetical protein